MYLEDQRSDIEVHRSEIKDQNSQERDDIAEGGVEERGLLRVLCVVE